VVRPERCRGDGSGDVLAEDAQFGDKRGDELPPELADRKTRKARLKEAEARLEAAHAAKAQELDEWEAAKAATIAHR
jgi:hypothetical protein